MTTTKHKVAVEWRPHIPKGFSGPADTPVEALLRAQDILFEEDKWVKQAWFHNEHPEVDPEDPFCNNWNVCAAGAVLMVTVGAARVKTRIKWKSQDEVEEGDVVLKDRLPSLSDPESFVQVECPIPQERQSWGIVWSDEREDVDTPEGWDVYQEALGFLTQGAVQVSGLAIRDVPAFNDNYLTTRTDVLKAFSRAIVLASAAEAEKEAVREVTQELVATVTGGVRVSPKVVV